MALGGETTPGLGVSKTFPFGAGPDSDGYHPTIVMNQGVTKPSPTLFGTSNKGRLLEWQELQDLEVGSPTV
jgi:hypothetical protein